MVPCPHESGNRWPRPASADAPRVDADQRPCISRRPPVDWDPTNPWDRCPRQQTAAGCCIGQGQQPRATDATGNNRLAADQRGCDNTPRLPMPTSPLRLRHEIGEKQPDPCKLWRGFGIVWFCRRGLRPATQLRQPASQKQASTDTNGQSAVFISSGALPPSCCRQKSTPQKQAGHQHNAPGNSVISHRPHSCCWPDQQQSSHC